MEEICKSDCIFMKKVINKYGSIFYYNENGLLHREDGPAIEDSNGLKDWYKNGKLHREDGSAVEYPNGKKEYWYNDIKYPEIKTDEEWKRFVKLMVFQ